MNIFYLLLLIALVLIVTNISISENYCSVSNFMNKGSKENPKNYSTLPNYVNTKGWDKSLHGNSSVEFGNPYRPYNSPWASDSPCGGCKDGEECKLMRDISPPYIISNNQVLFGVKGSNNWRCVSKKIDEPFGDCNECDHFSDVLSYYTVDRFRKPRYD